MTFGFIITRHVNSHKTNLYWNHCVRSIRKFYPMKKIVVIDDDSNPALVRPEMEYENVQYINSEFPRAGELLPYYYLLKHKFFPHAVIIHDSVFFQKRIHFEKLLHHPVLPLWHFDYKDEIDNCLRLTTMLRNGDSLMEKLRHNPVESFAFRQTDKWHGCFGVQSIISIAFVQTLHVKYNLFALLKHVKTRKDRCALERIAGAMFYGEYHNLYKIHSLFGNIWRYEKWEYTYDEYIQNNAYKMLPIVKVWTGR